MKLSARSTGLYIVVWMLGAISIAFVLGNLYRPLYVRLVAHGQRVDGVVTAVYPKPHDIVEYTYVVAGRSFHQSQCPWLPNPRTEWLRAGDLVTVYYNKQNPAEALLGDPTPKLNNENASIILAAVLLPVIIIRYVRTG